MSAALYRTAPAPTPGMPGGVPYIVANEAAERFSYYGMRSILVVFMTKHLVDSSGAEEARAGSIVTLKYDGDDDDDAERYLIGSIEERHPEVDHVVSPSSPLGEQLLGAKVGDTVTYESPAGAQTVVVLGIE